MNRPQSVEVPFIAFGNRRGFTHTQLVSDPIVCAFYERFRHCFEPHPNWNIDAVLFREDDTP